MFFILFIFEMAVASMMFSLIGFEDDSHKFKDLFEQMPKFLIFLMAVIAAPFLEEFIFRGFLKYPLSLIGIIGLLLFGVIFFFKSNDYIDPATTLGMLFAAVGIIGWLFKSEKIQDKIKTNFIKYFGVIFYASVVIFAYVHIFNFNEIEYWYYTPILVLPQFILALYLGYIRVRNNIWASIYIHALNNAIPMSIVLLFPEAI